MPESNCMFHVTKNVCKQTNTRSTDMQSYASLTERNIEPLSRFSRFDNDGRFFTLEVDIGVMGWLLLSVGLFSFMVSSSWLCSCSLVFDLNNPEFLLETEVCGDMPLSVTVV